MQSAVLTPGLPPQELNLSGNEITELEGVSSYAICLLFPTHCPVLVSACINNARHYHDAVLGTDVR